jgi:IS5 family transposase
MRNRHIGFYGEAPRQTAAAVFASRHNLGEAKALGIRDVALYKKAGLRVMDMVKSNWVYRKLRNFRAGIELDTPIKLSLDRLASARMRTRMALRFVSAASSAVCGQHSKEKAPPCSRATSTHVYSSK